MTDSGIWKAAFLPFMLAIGGYAVYIYAPDSACERLDRALSPVSWIGALYQSTSGDDMGWNAYRLEAFDRLRNILRIQEACPQTADLLDVDLKRARSQEGITDEEKAILLGR